MLDGGGGRWRQMGWDTTPNQDRYLTLNVHRNCFMPAVILQNDLLQQQGCECEETTSWSWLESQKTNGEVASFQSTNCVCAVAHRTLNEWGTVLFTDESRSCLNFMDSCRGSGITLGRDICHKNVLQHDWFGSSPVWSGEAFPWLEGQRFSSLKMAMVICTQYSWSTPPHRRPWGTQSNAFTKSTKQMPPPRP